MARLARAATILIPFDAGTRAQPRLTATHARTNATPELSHLRFIATKV
jgi:hypothetical protein